MALRLMKITGEILAANSEIDFMAICPVCGYKNLPYPVVDNPICPSCFTEFGYDDSMKSFSQLRADWQDAGMPWRGSPELPQPFDWNPEGQLQDLLQFEQRAETASSVGFVTYKPIHIVNQVTFSTTTKEYVYGVLARNLGVRPVHV